MNKNKVRVAVRSFLEKMKAMDEAIPEELADDALEMAQGVADALEGEETVEEKIETSVHDEEEEMSEEKVAKVVEDTINRVLRKNGLIKDECMKELDELEEELSETKVEEEDEDPTLDVDGEEAVTVDPEKIGDSADAIRTVIRSMKPVIAQVKNPQERKRLVDSLVKAARMSTVTTTDYSSIFRAAASNAKKSMDEKKTAADSDYDLGQKIAEAWNPHYKKEG